MESLEEIFLKLFFKFLIKYSTILENLSIYDKGKFIDLKN